MRLKKIVLVLHFILIATAIAFAQQPKLIVSVIIDQFRYDYLSRFDKLFVKNGFKRLTEGGAVMTYAHYNYAHTETGPGHSSYLSGATPSLHGIIANEWYDRKNGKRIYCVSDPTVNTVGSGTDSGKMSPRYLIGSTFADQLRMSNNFHSKVIGIAIKDRSAILPAGKHPTGAYWFDTATGDFVTSTYYTTALPKWVADFNGKKEAESFLGRTWERLLPEEAYKISDTDEGHGENTLPGEKTTTFPHRVSDLKGDKTLKRFDAFIRTPFANQLTIDFAESAIVGEDLGKDDYPDLLALSFSANDYCGHTFGPYSQEVQDITLRLDRQMAEFFDFLEQHVGLKNVFVVLTADHGVAPTPEYATAAGLAGRRLSPAAFRTQIEKALEEKYGPGKMVLDFINNEFYLDSNALRAKGLSPEEVEEFIGRTALSTVDVQSYFTRESLMRARAPGVIGNLVLNGFYPDRNGDIVIIPKPFAFFTEYKAGTTHGTPHNYDTHVPIVFYGQAFKPGKYADEVYITDIAPTLSSVLGVQEPSGCVGKPITSILVRERSKD